MMVRLALTAEERKALRHLAIARDTSVSEMLTRAARRILRGTKENNPALSVSENDNGEENV
jgi:hypothetical protein